MDDILNELNLDNVESLKNLPANQYQIYLLKLAYREHSKALDDLQKIEVENGELKIIPLKKAVKDMWETTYRINKIISAFKDDDELLKAISAGVKLVRVIDITFAYRKFWMLLVILFVLSFFGVTFSQIMELLKLLKGG